MSIPLGTFNSEERVQISTAIRLARQLPPGSSLFLFLLCLSRFTLLSMFPSPPPPPSLSFSPARFASLRNRVRIAFGICAGDF